MAIYHDLEVNILVDGDALEEFVGPPGSDYAEGPNLKFIEAVKDTTVAVKLIVGQKFLWYDATKLLLTIVLGGVQILSEIDRRTMTVLLKIHGIEPLTNGVEKSFSALTHSVAVRDTLEDYTESIYKLTLLLQGKRTRSSDGSTEPHQRPMMQSSSKSCMQKTV